MAAVQWALIAEGNSLQGAEKFPAPIKQGIDGFKAVTDGIYSQTRPIVRSAYALASCNPTKFPVDFPAAGKLHRIPDDQRQAREKSATRRLFRGEAEEVGKFVYGINPAIPQVVRASHFLLYFNKLWWR